MKRWLLRQDAVDVLLTTIALPSLWQQAHGGDV
jgi:hypothetical protein